VRNANGTFTRGNSAAQGFGRPEGAGKCFIKDMCWDSINTIAKLIFGMPEPEMKAWVEANKSTMSLAERLYVEASVTSLEVIEALLDRIVGKTMKVDGEIIERNQIIERLYSLSPEAIEDEIETMIRNREIIKKENESIKTGIVV
jgi:hypothetical protein